MDTSHYQHIAKEFMDLWQKQVSAAVSDKQFIHTMLEMLQSMQTPQYGQKPGQTSRGAATANTAHAPDAGNELLAELAYRISMCERRIATLEAEQHKANAKGKTGSKKTASSKAGKKPAGRAAASSNRGSKKPR